MDNNQQSPEQTEQSEQKAQDEKRLQLIKEDLDYLMGPWPEVIFITIVPPVVLTFFLMFMGMRPLYAGLLGFISWNYFYFKKVFEHLWISGDPDQILLLQNVFMRGNSIKNERQLTDPLALPRDIRAVAGSGFNPKLPWEKVLGVPIDTTAGEIKSNTITVEDANKQFWLVTWNAPVTIIGGKYAARSPFIEEHLAIEVATGVYVAKFRECFRSKNGDEILRDQAGLKKDLAQTFGGARKITLEEIQYGRSFGTPFITNIVAEGQTKKAIETGREADALAAAVGKLAGEGTKLTPQQAAALLMAQTGNTEIVQVSGDSENAPIIPIGENQGRGEGRKWRNRNRKRGNQ